MAMTADGMPWPAGDADPDALRSAVAMLTGPIACRTTTLRACALGYLLRQLPQLRLARHRDLLRRLAWLTDPRTEDPQELLIRLTDPRDPLAPTPQVSDGIRQGGALRDFPLADWRRTGTRGESLRLSGRVLAVRRHSRVIFADLAWDGCGLQLCLDPKAGTQIHPGDLVVVSGRTGSTRSGRNAMYVDVVEQHVRGAQPRRLSPLIRTGLLAPIRRYLDQAGFHEAITSILGDSYRGGAARAFTTWAHAAGRSEYLRVTTEPALLELISAGFTRCYEVGPSFRNERLRGQPVKEFTMLEAYAGDLDRAGMLDHVTQMILAAYPDVPPLRHTTFDEAFEHLSHVRPTDAETVRSLAAERIPEYAARTNDVDLLARRIWRNELRGSLPGFVALTGIPGPASPLIEGQGRSAERTWLYLHGIEIAEISQNERRPEILAAAFAAQFASDSHAVHRDYRPVLTTFEAGLPPVAGVGMGLNRLAEIIDRHVNSTPEE